MNTSDLIGHSQIVTHLTSAVSMGKISHAYILHGEKGMGKKFLARYFAKLLQCENPVNDALGRLCPCNECKSCKQADGDNHPDIITVTHEKAGIGVDDIRLQVNGDIAVKPYSSRYKIYIIPEADKMTEAAQNALLKTVEEPPEYGILFLLADNTENLLPTIHSRCVSLQLRPEKDELIRKYLSEALGITGPGADIAVSFAGGNIGKAVKYAGSEEFDRVKSDVVEFLRQIDTITPGEVLSKVKDLAVYKADFKECIDLMQLWFRDILVYKTTGDEGRIIFKDEKRYIKKLASLLDYEKINEAASGMNEAKKRLDSNVNFDTTIELMLINMIKTAKGQEER